MSDEKLSIKQSSAEPNPAYEAPAIEEVVSREGLEREVAYAGVVGGSVAVN